MHDMSREKHFSTCSIVECVFLPVTTPETSSISSRFLRFEGQDSLCPLVSAISRDRSLYTCLTSKDSTKALRQCTDNQCLSFKLKLHVELCSAEFRFTGELNSLTVS